jgi:hypothetical protein
VAPHRQGADTGDEGVVAQRAVAVLPAFEKPVERVIRVGDEAVERGRRVVRRERHRGDHDAVASPTFTPAG